MSVNSLGVPHASVFGPILFSICISDLTRAACCKMHLRVYHAVLLVAKPKTEDVHTNRNREINSAAKRRIANKLTDIDKKNSWFSKLGKSSKVLATFKLWLGMKYFSNLKNLSIRVDNITMKIGKIKRFMSFLSKTTRKLLCQKTTYCYHSDTSFWLLQRSVVTRL